MIGKVRRRHRNNHQAGARLLASVSTGPRIVPDIIGGDPMAIVNREPWMERANCLDVDPEIFYPEHGNTTDAPAARRICGRCPVRTDCLDHALATREPFGIWGGLSVTERHALRRKAVAS